MLLDCVVNCERVSGLGSWVWVWVRILKSKFVYISMYNYTQSNAVPNMSCIKVLEKKNIY